MASMDRAERIKLKGFSRLRGGFHRVPTTIWWIFPFVAVEIALASYGFSTFRLPFSPLRYAEPLRPSLITAAFTVAIFAVNFSFFSIQLSVYRGVLRGLRSQFAAYAAVTFLLTLTPVIVAAFSEKWVATAAVLALPALAYTAILLNLITAKEASAKPYVQRLSKKAKLDEFIQSFRTSAAKIDRDPPELVTPEGTPPPVHEMGWLIYPVSVDPDPTNDLATICSLAADSGDIGVYVAAVEALLNSTLYIHNCSYSGKTDDLAGNELLRNHTADCLDRVSALHPGWDTTGLVTHRFIHACAAFVRKNDLSSFPLSSLALTIVKSMARGANRLVSESIEQQAVDAVVVARRAAVEGLKAQPREMLIDMHHRFTLAGHAKTIQELGEAAVTKNNAHLLFRCIDTLGFLGCSAVKVDNFELGTACLLGLVQLGRLARKGDLQCFWDRCALKPEDHAEKGMEWMLSWTPKKDKETRERWARSISDALSRLRGFEIAIDYVEKNEALQPNIRESKNPYIYSVNENGRFRSYDFSQKEMTRELVIY